MNAHCRRRTVVEVWCLTQLLLLFLSSGGCHSALFLCDFFHALVRLALFWAHKGLRGLDYFSATDMINGLLSAYSGRS
ncbi:hypothetical protein, partial [Aeromonas caviae]|uniref:hypothetical protein n=1 Tax=Aeromonas caviae TaxID=648 RepID=UPI0029DE813B